MRSALAVVVMVVAGLPMLAGVPSSASVPLQPSVTVTADPPSGSEVRPGDSITYTLTAVSPDGARVVDDLSGLLGNATVMSTAGELADGSLTLDLQARAIAWDVPASTVLGTAGSEATTSFRVRVADTAPEGAQLITAAAAAGDTCVAGGPCATTLTVARPPDAVPNRSLPETPESLTPESTAGQAPTSIPEMAQEPTTESAAPPPAESTTAGEPSDTEQPGSTTTTDVPSTTFAPETTSAPETVTPDTSAAQAATTPASTPAEPADGTGGAAAGGPASDARTRTGSPAPDGPAQQALAVDALAGPCTGAAPAPGSPVAGFEIDGNLCTDNPGTIDWDTAGGQLGNDGARDSTQFTQGAKESNWPWSPGQTQGDGVAPDSTDITNVHAFTTTAGDVYAFVAFERVATTGTVAYHLELNQRPNTFGPTPNRTANDLRLTIEQQGSSLIRLTAAERWTGTAWQALGSLAGFVGQVNQVPVTNLSGTTLSPGQFAEIAVDLTTLFGQACSGEYGTLNIRSSSSTSETSSLNDWVNPVALNVPDTCPSVLVDKTWVIDGTTYADGSQPAGFSAALSLTGQTNPLFGVTYSTRSDGTRYQVGDAVTVGEAVSPLPPGCSNVASGDGGSHTLVGGLNSFAITNTVTCTYLTLRKTVVGGSAAPAQWTLSATGPTTVTGPGNSTAVTRVHVAAGLYQLAETGPTGYQQTSLTCAPGSLSGGAVTLVGGDDVTCTFTNTAAHPVVLTKAWSNATSGDTVGLQITNGAATATGTSTAPSSTTNATLTAVAGDTVALAETFTTGDPAHYATILGCDNGAIVTNGSFTVPSALPAGATITCTFTNARRSATLTLRKSWVNGADGDTADISIDGATSGAAFATATAPPPDGTGLSTNTATRTVFSGDTVTVAETFGAGNTGTYGTGLICSDAAGLVYDAGALSGSYTVPAAPSDVVCSFTNTRTSATLILQKQWVDGAAGDQAGLVISGSDPGTSGSAVSTATGAAGSETDAGNRATATIFSGETVTVNEDLPPDGHTNAGSYASTITCGELGTRTGRAGQAASGVVPDDPVPVLCTVTNTRTSASLVLQKVWVSGAAEDTADLSINGATADPEFATATVPAGGTGGSIDKATVTLLSGDTVALAEVLGAGNAGSYASQITCNRPGLTPDADGRGGSFAVPASPEAVTCTIINIRTSAPLVLRKTWVNAAALDTADLTITGSDRATFGSATSTATGAVGAETDTGNRATAAIFSGGTVDLAETLGAGNTGSYTSQIACDQPGLTPDGDGRGGTYQVPGTPAAVTCTITNTRTSAPLILRKTWVDGAAADTAALAVSADPATSGSATSTATGAAGSETDTANRATATIFSGQSVDLAETLGAGNTGSYTAQIVCDQPGLTPDGDGRGGIYGVPGTPAAVTCTITNTRTSAPLILQKTWVNGAAADTAALAVNADPATSGSGTSTATGAAGSETDTANRATATIFSGQTVNLAETLGAGNTGSYTAQLTCDQPGLTPDGDGRGGTYQVPGTPAAVTCTITNTRTSAPLILQKTWVNGALNDAAGLAIANPAPGTPAAAVSTASGAAGSETDTAHQAATTVLSGETVGLAEVLGAGNTGTYTSQLTCDQPGLTPTGDGRTGTYLVPATPLAVTCTITNTRTSAGLILQKTWVNGASGDTTLLSITGVAPDVSRDNTSTANGVVGPETDTGHQAIATVYSGQTLVLGEIFGSSNGGTYTVDLTCTDPARLSRQQNAESGTYTVPSEPSDVTCTFINARTSAALTLRKEWVDGAAGDTAALTITGSDPGTSGSATSTATGTAGSEIDTDNQAAATIFSGGTVALVEALGTGNTGSYSSQIACSPADGFTAGQGGQGGTYQAPAAPVAVTCTITNTRASTALILQKTWVNGALGDTAALSIDDATTGPGFATATVPASGNGLSTDKATVTVLSGASVNLAETLGVGNTGSYTAQLACDQPGLTTDGDGRGGSYQVPLTPTPVNCTFTNAGPASVPTVTKSVSSTTQNGDGSWTIVYDVAVGSAPTAAMTQYTLTDTLAFGSGIAVNSAHVDGPADETLNPNWNGSTDTTVVTSGTLQTGETDHYTVTVNATVTSEAAAEDRACASGGGFANSAQVGLAPPVFTAALAAAQADPTAAQDASACADPASPMITKQVIGSAQHPGDATWDVTYSLSVTNPATTTGLVYSLTDTPGFPPGVPVNSATVTAAHDSTGTPITGLINTWDGNTLFIITAKDLAAGVTDTYTLVINTTVTTQDGSTNQCQTGDSGHGYLNTGAVTSGQDTVTAQACTAIAQPVPPPDPTPAAPPSPAPLLPNTGVAVTDFLTTAFGLLITGTLLLLISRRRTRNGCRGPGRGGCSGSPGHSCC